MRPEVGSDAPRQELACRSALEPNLLPLGEQLPVDLGPQLKADTPRRLYLVKNLTERLDSLDFEAPLLVDDEVAWTERPTASELPDQHSSRKKHRRELPLAPIKLGPRRRRRNPDHILDRHRQVVWRLVNVRAGAPT